MTIGRYDSAMFVWTDEGYKNQNTIRDNLNILTMNLGQQEFADPKQIFIDIYTGNMVKVYDSHNNLMFSVSEPQRMFWFPRIGKPQIGSAGEFYEQIQENKTLILPVLDGSHVISHHVEKSQVKLVKVTDYPVWGVQSSSGNLVFKADSVPVLFSDCG